MNKNKKMIMAITIALVGVFQAGTVFAAPSEIYGYKRMEAWDFHDYSYDKDENIRVIPNTNIFDTKGKFGKDGNAIVVESENKRYKSKKVSKKVDLMASASTKSPSGNKDKGNKGGTDIISGASTVNGCSI